MKPADYRQRRTWQNEARARGEIPECGREACHRPADPAWLGSGTGVELLYCAGCAGLINHHTPGTCRPEVSVAAAAFGIAMRTALDTLAATTNIPTDPKLNRAQRRERDRQRWRGRWAAGGGRG